MYNGLSTPIMAPHSFQTYAVTVLEKIKKKYGYRYFRHNLISLLIILVFLIIEITHIFYKIPTIQKYVK